MYNKFLYGRKWRKARSAFLKSHPLCIICTRTGTTSVATVVDHITPHKGDLALFWDQNNWQPLCENCHNSYKQAMDKSGVIRGCQLDGQPTDPNHHWNIGKS